MVYEYHSWGAEDKARRNEYWRRLRAAWNDYQVSDLGPYGEPNLSSFKYFMERRYGLRVNMVGDNIDNSYQIIDEKKHALFVLKYGST